MDTEKDNFGYRKDPQIRMELNFSGEIPEASLEDNNRHCEDSEGHVFNFKFQKVPDPGQVGT